jgi:dipeptidase
MRKVGFLFVFIFVSMVGLSCTNIIVTKGASTDGSAFLAYTNDAEYIAKIYSQPARNYPKGAVLKLTNRSGKQFEIPQAQHTYALLGFHMNEHQLCIGETTSTGRLELMDQTSAIEYWQLMKIALERAKTAREAISVMTDLVETFGYASEGESFSIVDKEEAWILEMFGTGETGNGAIWVARRIPDGMISAHANKTRITEFPLDDPENCLYSENVISFAIENGYYNPNSEHPFRFDEAYCPAAPDKLRYCSTRVWSIFQRAAPSLNMSPDYHRGVKNAAPYPLWIKPDNKIGLTDMFDLVRDHYEGTDWDMTKGYAAGPFNNPNRNRPLVWEVDGTQCSWERPISTYNSAFTFVAQVRPHLPDAYGGIVWYGVDDSYVTCYQPLYSNITEIPIAFRTGDIKKFSWKSAWWVFNFVSNYANLRYADMIKEIQFVQDSIETSFISQIDSIDSLADELLKNDYQSMQNMLTVYAAENMEMTMLRWIELGEHLITKYNDGYVKDDNGKPQAAPYSDDYLRQVKSNEPKRILPVWSESNEYKSPDNF